MQLVQPLNITIWSAGQPGTGTGRGVGRSKWAGYEQLREQTEVAEGSQWWAEVGEANREKSSAPKQMDKWRETGERGK